MEYIQRKNIELSYGRGLFKNFLRDNGFGADITEKFDLLTELYFKFNSIINISALKTPDDVYIKHYIDSVYPYKLFEGDCCDVGCGGGFPCIPLAIITKNNFLGIDGVGKKLKLIDICREELSLSNIRGMHIRSNDLAKQSDGFDTVCARAVAETEKVISYCAPLAKTGGKIILYKTQNDQRLKTSAESKYKVGLSDCIDFVLPGTDIKRRVFVYRKI